MEAPKKQYFLRSSEAAFFRFGVPFGVALEVIFGAFSEKFKGHWGGEDTPSMRGRMWGGVGRGQPYQGRVMGNRGVGVCQVSNPSEVMWCTPTRPPVK